PAGNSLNGTPIPPVEAPLAPAAGEVPPVPHGPPPGPVEVPPPDGAVPVAPSGFGGNASGGAGGPSVAFAHYDPRTGRYLTPDGQLQQLTISGTGSAPKSWKDLLPT
ncbi:MAG TPA: mammalian cell entry protein, partial [Mycobacterium sp.]|nr:mammalian cell entry protein [Mycobacterium sp.]